MGDVDLDFGGRGVSSAGGRAIASPRSVDKSKSLSGTRRPVEASEVLGASVSSLSSGGGGGGGSGVALCVASAGFASEKR
jgi:hypothetical protein